MLKVRDDRGGLGLQLPSQLRILKDGSHVVMQLLWPLTLLHTEGRPSQMAFQLKADLGTNDAASLGSGPSSAAPALGAPRILPWFFSRDKDQTTSGIVLCAKTKALARSSCHPVVSKSRDK